MKNTKKNVSNNNFWTSPEKLNRTTIFLLILAYVFLLLGILFISFPGTFLNNNGNVIKTDFPHVLYDEDLSAIIKISNLVKKEENSTEEDKLFNQFSISAAINKNSDISISKYQLYYNAVYGDGSVKYFSTNKRSSFPHTYQMLTRTKVPNRQIEEISGEIHYEVAGENRVLKYSEKILKLTTKEMNNAELVNSSIVEDVFKIDFTPSYYDISNYNYKINIEVTDQSQKYHLDMQSWVESSEGRTYPLLGVYNMQYKEKKFASTDNEKIAQVTHPENIYFKVNYYDNDAKLSTYLYRFPFPSLTE